MILNVDNGPHDPSPGRDAQYLDQFNAAKKSGVTIVGYVDTSYTHRAINSVNTDIDDYYRLYPGIDGIFFDQTLLDDACTNVSYYEAISSHVKSQTSGPRLVISNPGTDLKVSCYQNSADIFAVFESAYSAYQNWSPVGWEATAPASRFWHIVYETPENQLSQAVLSSKARNAGYVYFTDVNVAGNYYGNLPLPQYWQSEVQDVKTNVPNTPTTTPIPHKPDTIGIFRPSTATFYLRGSNTQGFADLTVQYGNSNSYPVVGNWTGSGVSTIGVFDPSNGQFQLRNSNTPGPADETFVLGIAGDQPFAGRWQAGAADDGVGVFRPSNGLIYLKNELGSGFADFTMVLGIPGDVGVAGDWDGNGISSPGVFRPNIVTFYLSDQVVNGSVFGDHAVTLGYPGDTPFAGDWIAQGHAGVGVFRPTNGLLYLKNDLSSGFADVNIVYGIPNDIPVAGHWGISSAPAPHNSVIVPNTPLPAAASATPTQPRLRLTQPGSYDG